METDNSKAHSSSGAEHISIESAQSEQGTSVMGVYISSDPETVRKLKMLFEESGISLEKAFAEMVDKLMASGKYKEE